MSKKKQIDKVQARERRNRMLESAAAAELSLTEGVREMRAIAGMTQEEFAQHRGVSARVIKAIELDKGNPTVATLNRIGQFFGLEVAFVPIKQARVPAADPGIGDTLSQRDADHLERSGPVVLPNLLEEMQKQMNMTLEEIFTRHIAKFLPKESLPVHPNASDTPAPGKKPRSR